MASLEKRGRKYRIVFRFGGQKFTSALKTKNEKDATASLSRLEDQLHGLGETAPRCLLDRQLLPAGARQHVELRVASGIGLPPFRLQPPFLFEPVQGGVQRALVDLHDLTRDLLQPLRDRIAVRGLERQHLQDQHVERALREGEA